MLRKEVFHYLKHGSLLLRGLRCDRLISFYVPLHDISSNDGINGEKKQSVFSHSDLVQRRLPNSIFDPIVSETGLLIKSIRNTEDVLQFLENNPKLNVCFYQDIFSTIHRLQKTGHSKISNEKFIEDPNFQNLCVEVKKNVRFIQVPHIVVILKALLMLGVSSNSSLGQHLLQMISKNVNKLNLPEVIFLNFLLTKCSPCPLVDGIKIAIPIVFEAVVRFQLDRKNKNDVYSSFLFAYLVKQISRETREFLVDAADEVKDDLDALQALKMLRLMCKVNHMTSYQMPLYNHLMNNVAKNMKNSVNFFYLNSLTAAVIDAYIYSNESYLHETFFENLINFVINEKLPIVEAAKVLRSLSRICYPAHKLLDYVDEKLLQEQDFDRIESLEPFIAFLSSCSDYSYRPKYWSLYQKNFIKLIDQRKTELIPLLRIVVDLVTMKCLVTSLMQYCFNEEFLRTCLNREENKIDYLNLLTLYQVAQTIYPAGHKFNLPPPSFIEKAIEIVNEREDFPIESAITEAVRGSKYVLSGVGTRYGHFIDHLVVKRRTGKMMVINEDEVKGNSKKIVQPSEFPEGSLLIAVLLFSPASYCLDGMTLRGKEKLQIYSLEALGYAVVPISHIGWNSLLDREKIPYLLNKIETRTFAPNFDEDEATVVHLEH